MSVAVFGGGCFWCLEAVFSRLRGVSEVLPGYSGGVMTNPDYDSVCMGMTGHAEVIQLRFDPALITYRNLLEVFFSAHDPTTLNRQGNDVGTQYRSVIFVLNEEQLIEAGLVKMALAAAEKKIFVTEVAPLDVFYPAEVFHQRYFSNNATQPYCAFIIQPKVEKITEKFCELIRPPF